MLAVRECKPRFAGLLYFILHSSTFIFLYDVRGKGIDIVRQLVAITNIDLDMMVLELIVHDHVD